MALSVFAMVSVLAYSGLQVMIRSREQVSREMDRLADLQRALAVLSRDVEQTVARPVREIYEGILPALVGEGAMEPALELTRSGWRNPAGRSRSTLQRVGYRLEEHKLWREAWPVLDRGSEQEPFRYPLLDGVEAMQARFLDEGGEWHQQWPPAGGQVGGPLPRAMEIVLELADWGQIRRLLPLSLEKQGLPGTAGGQHPQ